MMLKMMTMITKPQTLKKPLNSSNTILICLHCLWFEIINKMKKKICREKTEEHWNHSFVFLEFLIIFIWLLAALDHKKFSSCFDNSSVVCFFFNLKSFLEFLI